MTKLHILLITTLLGVGLYMFLIYKEIKLFERDVADLRIKVQSFAASIPHPSSIDIVGSTVACPLATTTTATPETASRYPVPEEVNVIAHNSESNDVNQDIDDNASVTSNEIQEILTNIQEINEDELEADAKASPPSSAPSSTSNDMEVEEISSGTVQKSLKVNPKTAALKLADLTDDEIRGISYDNLCAILRNHGVANPRGTKSELVNKALEVKTSRKVLNL